VTRTVDNLLAELRTMVLRMGGLAEGILAKAMQAASTRDADLAREVEQDDLEIDRLDVAIDEAVLEVLALQAPVAHELRQVLAIKMMATDIERVGDLARNVAKSAIRLAAQQQIPLHPELDELSVASQRILRCALDCFSNGDTEGARGVLEADDRIDALQDQVIQETVERLQSQPEHSSQLVDVILIAKNLERVADHATNIAEDVILIREALNVKHAAKLAR
jgi:phosphate transport system protein